MARKPNAEPPAVVPNGHDKESDVEIEGAPIDETEIVAEPAITATAPAVDPGVESLKEQLATERRRREEAEANIARLANERTQDQKAVVDSRLLVIDSTIQTNETKLGSIKDRIRKAKEAGDFDAETDALTELTEVTGDLKQAKLGKARLEEQIEEAKNQPAKSTDPLEAYFEANNVGPRSRDWLRNHRDILEDPVRQAELTRAHHLALRGGAKVNTDEYFESIESEMGLTDEPAVEPAPRARAAAPAAPVTRSGGLGDSPRRSAVDGITILGPNKYRVTPQIAEAAQIAGITVKEYVEEALKLQRGSDGQLH